MIDEESARYWLRIPSDQKLYWRGKPLTWPITQEQSDAIERRICEFPLQPMEVGMKPGFGRLVCTEISRNEKTVGGIVIPDVVGQKVLRARVIGFGERRKDGDADPSVFRNHIVWFESAYATEIKHDGIDMLVVDADCVIASEPA